MSMNRRDFIKGTTLAGLAAASGCTGGKCCSAKKALAPEGDYRAFLVHLGHNMWHDPQTEMGYNEKLWNEVNEYVVSKGVNMLMVDVGEGVVYPSYPELAIKGSWTADRVAAFVDHFNAMGVEVVPKINFSATHDAWLGLYHRMVSTRKYYDVTRDVIRDVIELFKHPRYVHLGWDEETASHQSKQDYVVVRQGDLWWNDFLHTIKCTEDAGARAWVWSDYGWHHPEYVKKCPKSVLQSNWYYDESYEGFDLAKMDAKARSRPLVQLFVDLDKAGFDQVPCGTNWVGWKRKNQNVGADDVIGKLVKFGRANISKDHLKGFLMAPWGYIRDQKAADFAKHGMDLFADALKQS